MEEPQELSLLDLFDGWDTYNTSLVHAVAPLTLEQLAFRPAPGMRSAGEIAAHISIGRISWFSRMDAPGSAELNRQFAEPGLEKSIAGNAGELARWLEVSWVMVADSLRAWHLTDLSRTYRQPHQGKVYAVSYQWTIWRIIAHDLHHGGELAAILGMQGIQLFELGDLGGHLTVPPLAEE